MMLILSTPLACLYLSQSGAPVTFCRSIIQKRIRHTSLYTLDCEDDRSATTYLGEYHMVGAMGWGKGQQPSGLLPRG
ncbi:hypothetical protein BO71DRAFT_176920 [Aspergillus ellipticus CBS 707.79]|uniref:Secreted protein n=1 Tax=Aspergillus ellipticus CBS 707.79 TaxID=1448320 RepID=A0A319DGI2_9EURO|nr:hypothetical protein BO71DRAFT_176920 [Aspergillus ellipticus CBS 707.79]